ncbi:MAG: Crp/Fnr family transcriptional regulator [Burkholderiaceae bacterium]|nr:Crp/Fnr family transcriptional regulator [Burkholderiaceae bacterium]
MKSKIVQISAHSCVSCGMRGRSLFADLQSDDFALIDQPIHDLQFEPQETLFEEGAPGAFLFTVRSGIVKLVRFQSDGTQRIVRLLTSGDVAGLETSAGAHFDSTAIALTRVSACRIPRAVIDRLEAASPRLHTQLLRKWHDALKQSSDFIAELATGNARQRLARLLLQLAQDDPAQRMMLPSREDVGAMLGVTTETASRAVAAFRREGLLKSLDRQGKHFVVDVQSLRALAEGRK